MSISTERESYKWSNTSPVLSIDQCFQGKNEILSENVPKMGDKLVWWCSLLLPPRPPAAVWLVSQQEVTFGPLSLLHHSTFLFGLRIILYTPFKLPLHASVHIKWDLNLKPKSNVIYTGFRFQLQFVSRVQELEVHIK